MARPQVEVFLQIEFKRLAQEAGVKGARIHVERAIAADYELVIREVAPCLRSATAAEQIIRVVVLKGARQRT